MPFIKLTLSLLVIYLLQGCVAATSVVVVTGATIASDERAFSTQIDDEALEIAISNAFFADDAISKQANLTATVINAHVLIVGQAPSSHIRDKAITIVNNTKGVKKVFDQIRIRKVTNFSAQANDMWLTSKVKTTLITNQSLDATNIKVVTENAEVFLMGIVTKENADTAIELTRHTSGVSRVYKMFEYVTTP